MADAPLVAVKRWFQKQAEKEAKRDILKRPDRYGNLVGIVCIIIVLIFFAVHLNSQTGFFTSDFGAVSAFLFFGSTAWGIIPSAIRFVTGRKNPSKLPDIVGSLLVLIAILYFLASFQFDLSHLADPLPGFLKWAVQWITADFVKAVMVLGTIVLIFVIPYQMISNWYLKCELEYLEIAAAKATPPAENKEEPKQ